MSADGKTNGNRRQSRGSVLHSGICVVGTGVTKISCTIREISRDGMRITFAFAQKIPGKVWIIDLSNKTAYQTAVIWNTDTEAGLSILVKHVLSDIQEPSLKFLRRIWSDRMAR